MDLIADQPGAGQWAVILGVSSGTGAAIARAAASRLGLNVFGVHRGHYLDQALALEQEVRAMGRRIHLRTADAGTWEGAVAGVEELATVAGENSVKLFVHSIANASLGPLLPSGDKRLQPRHFHKTFDSMGHSFVYWTQQLVERRMLAPEARLLGLSNSSGDVVMRGLGLIAAVKAALAVYVKHLAHELGPAGHRVNLLKFAAVETPAVRRTFGDEKYEQLRRILLTSTPAGRMCTVEEVAELVALLTTERLSWFNGATIDFSGSEFQGVVDLLLSRASGEANG
jgi:NAD(P)-dependent dehydrogenase (short-subunit alcohol dehydrogenase family)